MDDLLVRTKNRTQAYILDKILEERVRQDGKFGQSPRGLHSSVWLTVIMEELGEVARSIIDGDSENYKNELIQVAACCVGALEDYIGGVQKLSLEDVGCGIQYENEVLIDEYKKSIL